VRGRRLLSEVGHPLLTALDAAPGLGLACAMTAPLSSLAIAVLGASVAWADVVTSVTGSKLVLTGDDSAERVVIEPTDGGLSVMGVDGTLVDGSSEAITVPGVRRLVMRLHEGADRVWLTALDLADGIDIRLGRGNDGVVFDRVHAGKTHIQTGNGYDGVQIFGPSTLKHLSITTGTGYDFVVVDTVWVPGDVHIDTGPDPDDVSIVVTEVGDDIDVDLGNDDDFLLIADVAIFDDTDLDGDDGDDVLVLAGYVWFEDDLDIDGFNDDWWW
jgi:hypothetical protein